MYIYVTMFTFNENKELQEQEKQTRVCRVEGGIYNDKIIYLNSASECKDEIKYDNPYELLPEDFFKVKNYKLMKLSDREKIKQRILQSLTESKEDTEDETEEETDEESEEELGLGLKEYYDRAKKIIDNKCKYEFEIHDGGKMQICPTVLPERVYISGQNGSGKSYLSGIYAREYNKLFPKNKIIMFSVHEKDKAYDEVKKMIRVNLKDESLTEKVLEVPKFKNTLVIFDDCDSIQDKKLKTYITNFELDLLTNGRKYNIYMLTLSHMLMNYKATREKINECSRVIMFGQAGSKYHITRFLRIHGGLDSKQIKRVFALPSRWFCISVNYPNYILYETGAYLLSRDNDAIHEERMKPFPRYLEK